MTDLYVVAKLDAVGHVIQLDQLLAGVAVALLLVQNDALPQRLTEGHVTSFPQSLGRVHCTQQQATVSDEGRENVEVKGTLTGDRGGETFNN